MRSDVEEGVEWQGIWVDKLGDRGDGDAAIFSRICGMGVGEECDRELDEWSGKEQYCCASSE
jgi:hypothetical protein